MIFAGMQATTREWWERRRGEYDVFVSEVVRDESALGDTQAARRRLEIVLALPTMPVTPEASSLARALVERSAIPRKAATDALHIAVAALNGAHFLLTWNCRHIANHALMGEVVQVCQSAGLTCPVLCTPYELLVR